MRHRISNRYVFQEVTYRHAQPFYVIIAMLLQTYLVVNDFCNLAINIPYILVFSCNLKLTANIIIFAVLKQPGSKITAMCSGVFKPFTKFKARVENCRSGKRILAKGY